ncbi:MAG: DUF5317 domain-containing protein [Ezakiella sp.]|nr:DUF5317 domain-containing protein [Ezakiella sp.]
MIIEALLFVFIFALIKKYSFINAQDFPQKGVGFPLIYVVIQIICFFLIKFGKDSLVIRFISQLSLLLFLPYFYFNRNYNGILLMAAGSILNMLVMYLNGGKMPIEPSYYRLIARDVDYELTYRGLNIFHSLIDENTKLAVLGDIIPLIKPYPFPKLISIGDILIAGGFLYLSISVLRGDYIPLREEEEKGEENEE